MQLFFKGYKNVHSIYLLTPLYPLLQQLLGTQSTEILQRNEVMCSQVFVTARFGIVKNEKHKHSIILSMVKYIMMLPFFFFYTEVMEVVL